MRGDNMKNAKQPEALLLAALLENGNRRQGDAAVAAELRRLHQQAERDIILLNRAANALAMLDCITDPTLAAELRDRLMQLGALPDLRD